LLNSDVCIGVEENGFLQNALKRKMLAYWDRDLATMFACHGPSATNGFMGKGRPWSRPAKEANQS